MRKETAKALGTTNSMLASSSLLSLSPQAHMNRVIPVPANIPAKGWMAGKSPRSSQAIQIRTVAARMQAHAATASCPGRGSGLRGHALGPLLPVRIMEPKSRTAVTLIVPQLHIQSLSRL